VISFVRFEMFHFFSRAGNAHGETCSLSAVIRRQIINSDPLHCNININRARVISFVRVSNRTVSTPFYLARILGENSGMRLTMETMLQFHPIRFNSNERCISCSLLLTRYNNSRHKLQQTVCCQENQFITYYLLTLRRGDAQGFRNICLGTPWKGFIRRDFLTRFISDTLFERMTKIFISKLSIETRAFLLDRIGFYPLAWSFVVAIARDCIKEIRSLEFCHRSRPKIYFGLRALATSLNKTIMKAVFDRGELIGDS